MAKVTKVSVAKDFSRFPAGRFTTDGPASGELFRDGVLAPALRDSGSVVVLLDGTLGYGSSFLEEAFGGLVRVRGFTAVSLRNQLSLVSTDPTLAKEIWGYIEGAKPVKRAL